MISSSLPLRDDHASLESQPSRIDRAGSTGLILALSPGRCASSVVFCAPLLEVLLSSTPYTMSNISKDSMDLLGVDSRTG